MNQSFFSQIDWGDLVKFLNDDDITDISYSNGGQVWLKSLTKGVIRVDEPTINNALLEKIAFQCSNIMGKTFNMAHPFLDAESAELRLNFVHESIATNGIACVMRKTPAKIRLNKDKLINEDYVSQALHDFLFKCVEGHCNIIVSGETGSGKTELVKYLAAHTRDNEKIITIEDTLELHLDRIFPHRDIVSMKTNNIASYSDVLVTCMRQNPRWILLSEVRSAEAVTAVRNSISSGHNIISTIHSDKASAIPMRLYSLLESNLDLDQFLKSMHRYIHIGIHVKGYMSKKLGRFQREIVEVAEFFVDDDKNEAGVNVIFKKGMDGTVAYNNPTKHLMDYLSMQGIEIPENPFVDEEGNFNPKLIEVAEDSYLTNPEPEIPTTVYTATGVAEGAPAPAASVPQAPAEPAQVKETTETVENTPVEAPKVEAPAAQEEPKGPSVAIPDIKEEVKIPKGLEPVGPTEPKINLVDDKATIDNGSIVNPNKGFEIIEEEKPVEEVVQQQVDTGVNFSTNAQKMEHEPMFGI